MRSFPRLRRLARRRPVRWALALTGWAGMWAAGWATGAAAVTPGAGSDPPGPADGPPRVYADAEAAALAERTAAAWGRIEAGLAAKAPAVLAALRGPADPAALDRLDTLAARPLPPDVRASLRRHDGMRAVPDPNRPADSQYFRPLGSARPYSACEMTRRAVNFTWAFRDTPVPYGRAEKPRANQPAALLLGVVPPREPGAPAVVRRFPEMDAPATPELLVDLRTGRLLTSSPAPPRERTFRPVRPLPGGEPPAWVDHLEALADRLERLPPDHPAFAGGGFDLGRTASGKGGDR